VSSGFAGGGNDDASLRRRCLQSCSVAWKDILKHSLAPTASEVAMENLTSLPAQDGEGRAPAARRDSHSSDDEYADASETDEDSRFTGGYADSGSGGRDKGPLASYSTLPPAVKIDLLESALSSARDDLDAASRARENDVRDLRSQLAEKDRETDQLRANVLSKSKQIRNLLSSLRSKEHEIQTCEMELQRYVRVPKEHTFGSPLDHRGGVGVGVGDDGGEYDLKNCTFAEFPADKYGEIPPTAMPLLGVSESLEGYLYREKYSGALWPVYYYKCPY